MFDVVSEKIESNKGSFAVAKQSQEKDNVHQSFCKTYLSKPQEEQEKLGNFFVVLEIKQSQKEASKIADIIIQIFEKEYYGKSTGKSFKSDDDIGRIFERSLTKVNSALKTLVEEEYLTSQKNINAAILCLKGAHLFLAYTGKIKAFLIRDDRMLELTAPNDQNKNTTPFQNVVSGIVKISDVLFMTTPELQNYFSNEKIKRTLTLSNINEAKSELENILNNADEVLPHGAVMIKIKSKAMILEKNLEPVFEKRNTFSYESRTKQDIEEKKPLENKYPALEEKNTDRKPRNLKAITDKLKNKISSLFIFPLKNKHKIPSKNKRPGITLKEKNHENPLQKSPLSSATHSKPIRNNNFFEKQKRSIRMSLDRLFKNFLRNKKSKYFILLIILIILVLIASISFISSGKRQTKNTEETATSLAEAKELEKKASDALIYKDTEKAKQYLASAKKIVEESLEKKITMRDEVKALNEKIQKDYDIIFKVNRVKPIELTSLQNNQDFKTLIGKNSEIYTFEDDKVSIFKFDEAKKDFKSFSENAEGISTIKQGYYNDQKEILTFLADNTLAEMPLYLKKISKINTEFPKSNHDFIDIAVYTDKIYLLDKANSQIYRHIRTVDGYNKGSEWLVEPVNLSDATSFAVDGDVYVYHQNGTITKLHRGAKKQFSIEGLENPLSANTKIYSSSGLDSLYLLDKDNKKIVVLNKNGQLLIQHFLEGIDTPADFYVDSKSNIIYLLADKKLFKIETP